MVRTKALKKLDRRQPEPQPLLVSGTPDSEQERKSKSIPHHQLANQAAATPATSKAKSSSRKRGHLRTSVARSKLAKGVEKADRLRTKASKRQIQLDKKRRVKEAP